MPTNNIRIPPRKSTAISVRSSWTFPETKVDVHNPDVLLNVELRANSINVYSLVIPGPGGMPVGTNGRAMLLLSGGIDSPVAGYMIAKRGVTIRTLISGVHFQHYRGIR